MISAVVLTKNEEKNIKNCLKSLLWCSEVVVIDDYSSDDTVKVVKQSLPLRGGKFKARILKRKLNNNFAEQRNFALQKAKNEWVFFVDADEIVTEKLAFEIQRKIREENCDGYFLRRRDFFMNRELKHGEAGDIKLLRLAKRNSGKWKRAVHEVWDVSGKIGILENPLHHFPHPTISEFVEDINKYSTLHAQENKKEHKQFNFLFVIFHPMGKFFVNYILKLGFLDGVAGFVVAVLMSFHSFLAWSKLWFI